MGILLLEKMAISVYTPVPSALVIITGVISFLIFREKHGEFSYLAEVVAIIVVII